MYLKKISVEEGFLHGLDLELRPGLVVLIGSRGAGKTSIIELIRFCLGGAALVGTKGDISRKQALAVLGNGAVTVTLDVDGEEVTFTRTAGEDKPRRSADTVFPSPLILSQNEIEEIGRLGDSRLKLLDEFATSVKDSERSEAASRSLIASLTLDINELASSVRDLKDEVQELEEVPDMLKAAKAEAVQANAHLDSASAERERLSALGSLISSSEARLASYSNAREMLLPYLVDIQNLANMAELEDWSESAGAEDSLAFFRTELADLRTTFENAANRLIGLLDRLEALQAAELPVSMALGDESRGLRVVLDELSDGAGTSLKTVNDLESLNSIRLKKHRDLRTAEIKLQSIKDARDVELDKLDRIRQLRVNLREASAEELNALVGPNVRIDVGRASSTSRYAEELANALKGKSGLQHNVLAPIIANSVSPRELVRAAENGDVAFLSDAAGISNDRAQRVIAKLADEDLGGLLTIEQDDTVQFSLLDGGEFKHSNDLSVGQRCTVILPIILSHSEKVIIVDQPEDNLDNSFVAETLVRVLLKRKESSQLIFATHNPNIPVLGNADQVIFLKSDGRRGEVASTAPLDDPRSVGAITDIMEGGKDAFETRARFYRESKS